MRTATYFRLTRLHACHGAREFGKICQKLVALAFRHGGFTHVVERGVQGVDVDAAREMDKYAAEIKTTTGSRVVYQSKDAAGLASRCQDGYRPLLGVLRLSALSDWYLVDATRIHPGALEIDALRPYRCHNLEAFLRPNFDCMVEQCFEGTLSDSQTYLDRALRSSDVAEHYP
jgi:hypothetical protein